MRVALSVNAGLSTVVRHHWSFPKSKRGQMTDDAKDSLLYTIQTAGGADAACRAERERIAFS